MAILRLMLLVLACVPVFIGFAVPFYLPGAAGLVAAFALLLSGTALIWFSENITLKWLEASGWFNDLLNTSDGDSE